MALITATTELFINYKLQYWTPTVNLSLRKHFGLVDPPLPSAYSIVARLRQKGDSTRWRMVANVINGRGAML